jgi:hypothetical protein
MKKIILVLLAVAFATTSCQDNVVKKPKNLIDKDDMINIIYDLSVLEAMKSQTMGVHTYPKPFEFLKKKYKVDSLTFVQNTQYYASDINEYKKMYEKVKEKIDKETKKIDAGKKPTIVPSAEEVGIVK